MLYFCCRFRMVKVYLWKGKDEGKMKCPNCGQSLSDTAQFCSKCGQPVHPAPQKNEKRKCPNCGYPLSEDAMFCNNCGQLIEDQLSEQESQAEPGQKDGGNILRSRRGHKIAAIIAVVVIAVFAVTAAAVFLKQPAEEPVAASQTREEDPEQEAAEINSKWEQQEQNAIEAEPEKQQPEEKENAEPSSDQESSEAVQVQEEWGQQEILISPKEAGKAVLTLRQKYQGVWTTLFECEAAIGRNGTTATPAEGDGKTPEGTFPVLFCYGLEQPQTGIPFIQLSSEHVWVDDSESEYYNCLTTREQAGDASFEDTYSQFARGYYFCNIFFANNGDGQTPGKATPGMGSVRVLEGYTKQLEPTNGDIKISADNMQALLELLNEKYSPVFTVSAG